MEYSTGLGDKAAGASLIIRFGHITVVAVKVFRKDPLETATLGLLPRLVLVRLDLRGRSQVRSGREGFTC
jgi:hypothetical protein